MRRVGILVNTVTGAVHPGELGKTLMHEHLFVQYGGVSRDYRRRGQGYKRCLERCIGFIDQIKGFGVASLVDPTTGDLGRHPELLAEVSQKTGMQVICCTGIYSINHYLAVLEETGGTVESVSEMFIKELTEGIDDTGIKAGAIKVVTSGAAMTDRETEMLLAAAKASVTTHAPVITHTAGILGDEQQRILMDAGVPAGRILIGHCCISSDFEYHRGIAAKGSYLGFDQIGMEMIKPDEVRVESMARLVHSGDVSHLIASHDSVWNWVGGPETGSGTYKNWTPVNFFERVIPMLHYAGVTDDAIGKILIDNPSQFFSA